MGIPNMTAGDPKIVVTFDIDAEGTLHVGAALMVAVGEAHTSVSQKVDIVLR